MAIVIKEVSHKYNEFENKLSINNISLELEKNNIFGIIGKSGSGKTTLLELIAGLIKPSNGQIFIDDLDIKKDEKKIRKKIGFIFQFPEEQLIEDSVKKEIEFSLRNFKISKNRVLLALKLVGLGDEYLNKKIDELSKGEKRMIAISSVLAYNPEIIIFDEPTIGLDYNNKKKLIKLIKMLKNKYGKTIIIASHDVDLMYQLCDNLIIIDNGILLLYGDPVSVYNEDKIVKKYDIEIPKIIRFQRMVKDEKNIKLMYTTSINDLIKEVYRNV